MVNLKTQGDQKQRNECKRLELGGLIASIITGHKNDVLTLDQACTFNKQPRSRFMALFLT